MKEHPINVTESEVRQVMQSFVSDLRKIDEQKRICPKWVSWIDAKTGLEVGEYQ
jgi:hypothetical protein